jgi:predicted Rossmann fold flavoprotein
MLLAECAAAGVAVRLRQSVHEVTRADRFRVATADGDIVADSLVLATGGLSIPKLGATGLSHDIARRFGLAVTPTRPALVPLTLAPDDLARTRPLSGVSLPVTAACGKRTFAEALLFTHRGLSGPAILQISSYWRDGTAVTLDLLPAETAGFLVARKRMRPKASLRTLLGESLPQRLADLLLGALAGAVAGDVPDKVLTRFAAGLKSWPVLPSGSEGYVKAEVTLGGVDTTGLSSRTMAAKDVPGLFVIGEAVDVTGWLGGYNFQWAWASGWCAGTVA